jgi:uncharacterized membrane protein
VASRDSGLRQALVTYALLVDALYWLVADQLLDKDMPWGDQGFLSLIGALVLLPLAVAIPAGIPVIWVASFIPREVKEGWSDLTPIVFTAVIGGIGAGLFIP